MKQTNWGGHLCCSFPAPPFDSSVATSHVSTRPECYFSVCVCLCCLHHIAGCSHCNIKTSLQVCSGMIISSAVTFEPGTHLKAADVSAQVRLQVISLSPAAADAWNHQTAGGRSKRCCSLCCYGDAGHILCPSLWQCTDRRSFKDLKCQTCENRNVGLAVRSTPRFTAVHLQIRSSTRSPDVTWSQDNVWFWTDKVSGYTVMLFPVFTLSSFKGPRRVHFKNV